MTERDRLVDELYKNISYIVDYRDMDKIADFILARDKRIVDPIKEHKESQIRMFGQSGWIERDNLDRFAMDETLKNAGVEL